ncbi:TolC family protein [Enterobacter sichuanensis]|uniref:TolC family protein n=1 Tax=Enterobacter sichuanensis TaxID=2071710 RepID=A0ABS6GIB4_9ENTR|nr:TolC family protein [Enterobacter sichuanensis]MBU5926162.1 TolC family protein [Enterobacter sichuanensis]OZU99823.1 transporter [Enterobacter cloacae]PAO09540.1 transporter [Enterobacter cloacae]
MVKARKERRWARVATAVALCLPCSSFVIPLHAADIAQAKSSLASLPPMRTQSQLNREPQPVPRTTSQGTTSQTSLPAMRTQSQYASTHKAVPVPSTARPARYASATPDREFAPASSTPAASRAALKKNADFFPPVTEYYKPDPAYAGVRQEGDGQHAISGRSQSYLAGSQDSLVFLRSMVARALAYSPELRAASAEVLASDYMVDQVKGQRMPQVRLGVTSPLSTVGGDRQSSSNNSHISDSSGTVSVNTPIIDWGRISNQVDNSLETAKAARYSKEYSREQLAYNTVSELMNMGRYQRSKVVAKQYVGRMKELVTMLSQITQADRGRESELVQAKAKLMSAQASLDNIEHQLSASKIKLVRLLGIEPELPEGISWHDTVIPASVALSALDKNPMMLNLQSKVRAAEYEAESIKSSALPQVNWVISKSTAKDSNGNEAGWYTGLNVEWEAFSGGSQRAAEMSARAKANMAQQQYEVSYKDLEYQINYQIQVRDSSFLRADDYDRLSGETDRVRRMFYEQWYHLGKRTLLDVLTAENDHFNNQLSAINNRYDGYISNINVIASASMLLSWMKMS